MSRVLRRQKCKFLGDAWLLYTALCEEAEDRSDEAIIDADCIEARNAERRRVRAGRGRWSGLVPAHDALHSSRPHFILPRSQLLFEPIEAGGVGAPPKAELILAGVVAIGHLCSVDGEWLLDVRDACRRNPYMQSDQVSARAWVETIDWLRTNGWDPVIGEAVPSRDVGFGAAQRLENVGRFEKDEKGAEVRMDKLDELIHSLADKDAAAKVSKDEWLRRLRGCCPDVTPLPAREWRHGGHDIGKRAASARLFFDVGGECFAVGGEARWMREADKDDDGYVQGWRCRLAEMRSAVVIGSDGAVRDADGNEFEAGAGLEDLCPALQMVARAAGEARHRENLEVTEENPPAKIKDPKRNVINVHAQRREADKLMTWQARTGADAVYTLDGAWDRIKVSVGHGASATVRSESRTAFASVRHDGTVIGGRMEEDIGEDNYLAELAAQICTAADGREDDVIIVEFDATSPIMAMLKFLRKGDRVKQSYYAADWIDSLAQKLSRFRAVVFVWQTSHVGAPCNDMADRTAETLMHSDDVRQVGVDEVRSFASILAARPLQGVYGWASKWALTACQERLASTSTDSLVRSADALQYDALPDSVDLVIRAVRAQRVVYGDQKRFVGRYMETHLKNRPCPFCKDPLARFDWYHAAFECGECHIVGARLEYEEALRVAADKIETGSGVPHAQISLALSALQRRKGKTRASVVKVPRPDHIRNEHCLLGGEVWSTGESATDNNSGTLAAVRDAVVAGAKLLQTAIEVTADVVEEVTNEARALHSVRKWARKWRRRVIDAGPARARTLRLAWESKKRAFVFLAESGQRWITDNRASVRAAGVARIASKNLWREAREAQPLRAADSFPRESGWLVSVR